MTKESLARPYAKAIFEFATEHKQIQKWGQFLQLAAAVVANPVAKELLNSPKMATEDKIRLIEDCCDLELTEPFYNFLRLLAEYQRLNILPEIATLFETLHKEQDKTVAVEVISAFAIEPAQKEKLLKALKIRLQREITAQFNINPALIGGTVIRAGDFVIDGSVRSKLDRMRQVLEG